MKAFQPSIKESDYFVWKLKYVTNRRGFSFDSFAFVVSRNYINIANAVVLFLVLFELADLTCIPCFPQNFCLARNRIVFSIENLNINWLVKIKSYCTAPEMLVPTGPVMDLILLICQEP